MNVSTLGFFGNGMSKTAADKRYKRIVSDDIGTPGQMGFGVGVCDPDRLPNGMVGLPGFTEPGHANYGNYQFTDGSVMVYIPAFFYKIGTGSNGLAVNIVDIKPQTAYANEIAANTDGYVMHLAFMDGGAVRPGVFVDKYKCSKNAYGSGYIASSLRYGAPISMSSDHNPVADLTACAGNYYYEAINAAHARDGLDGEINSNSIFFCNALAIHAALALLGLSHGQAATNTTNCAWYDSAKTTNYPKGCNNNALGDANDAAISYVSDGYLNCGKTGSGNPFAKTTHNGQSCGVADINGLMWEVSIGVTCIGTTKSITSATQGAPCRLKVSGHGMQTGYYVVVTGVGGMTEINDKIFTVTVVDADNITLDSVDSSSFAAYTSGGTVTFGAFYRKKDSVRYQDFTPGNSMSTDHWGATGVAAMMEPFDIYFESAYPSNGFSQRMGSAANQVLSEAVDGNGSVLTGLGFPKDAAAVDTSGANLFGQDYFYQYIRNELCVRAGGSWNDSSPSGPWGSYWSGSRAYSSPNAGFRCACYPV